MRFRKAVQDGNFASLNAYAIQKKLKMNIRSPS